MSAICDEPCRGGGSSAARKGSKSELGHMFHCNRKVETTGDKCWQHGNHRAASDVAEFNARYPVGTPVEYWSFVRTLQDWRGNVSYPAGKRSVTSTPAWLMGGHSAMVTVAGYSGGIALTHICPKWEAPQAATA